VNKILKNILTFCTLILLLTGCTVKEYPTVDENVIVDSNIIDINKNDFIGELSLHDAVRSRDIKIVSFLISEKSNVNAKDKYGYTPLHLAVRYKEFDIVKLLFESGAILNSFDVYGDTPLLDATRNKFTDLSEFLICNGAHRNVLDNHERSPLNYAAMTKDLYIANMLRETDLISHCKNSASISIDELDILTTLTPEICGQFVSEITDELTITLENESKKSYGPFLAQIDKETKTWCSQIPEKLEISSYKVTANTQSKSNKNLWAKEDFKIVIDEVLDISEEGNNTTDLEYELTTASQLEVDIDIKEIVNDSSPLICGNFEGDNYKKIDLTLESENKKIYGPYAATLDLEKNSWCAQVTQNLENGKYSVNALGMNENKEEATAQEDMRVYVLNSLYDALNEEFKDDFKKWDAQLEKDTLLFRFNSPHLMFKMGVSKLKNKYKKVLDDFFPRYIKTLEDYEHQIVNVFVEGHTSSEFKLGRDKKEKFAYNMELSEKRARKVVEYILAIDNEIVKMNSSWIKTTFRAEGKANLELVKNKDGTENQALSRRVEFKIITIPSEI